VGSLEAAIGHPDMTEFTKATQNAPRFAEIERVVHRSVGRSGQTVADARQFFKAHQRQVMIATGVNDPLFPGASVKPPADMPEIEFHPIDSGHFALEDHCAEIGGLTRAFLARVMPA
jgi:hypothetical protein